MVVFSDGPRKERSYRPYYSHIWVLECTVNNVFSVAYVFCSLAPQTLWFNGYSTSKRKGGRGKEDRGGKGTEERGGKGKEEEKVRPSPKENSWIRPEQRDFISIT